MKVWLASYPRSGNTYARLILHRVFGLRTSSLYNEPDHRPWLAQRMGSVTLDDLNGDESDLVVKTHEAPLDDSPAIYIVRDGRAAIVSYYHFLRAYSDTRPSIGELLEGSIWPGGWSDHFEAWAPLSRPRTLLLRYEDMVLRIERVIEVLAGFLNRRPIASFVQEFDQLHRLEPTLFRVADNARNVGELLPHHLAMYYRLHGDLAWRLGYPIFA
jgi:hypothetical protein